MVRKAPSRRAAPASRLPLPMGCARRGGPTDARHRAQELTDIADGRAPHAEHLPWLRGGKIDHVALMADANPAAIAAVIAEDHLQDRGFSGARWPRQHDAFAGPNLKRDAAHHREFYPALQMHGEGLLYGGQLEHGRHAGDLTAAGPRIRAAAYRLRADLPTPGRSIRSRPPHRSS